MTLLEKAKSIQAKGSNAYDNRLKYDRDEMLDIAIAYGKRELTSGQIKAVLEVGEKSNIQSLMANAVLSALRQGKIEVRKVEVAK